MRCLQLAKVAAPVAVLEWLTTHVTRNKMAHLWVLDQMELWVEPYLIAHNNARVRNCEQGLRVGLLFPCFLSLPHFAFAFCLAHFASYFLSPMYISLFCQIFHLPFTNVYELLALCLFSSLTGVWLRLYRM